MANWFLKIKSTQVTAIKEGGEIEYSTIERGDQEFEEKAMKIDVALKKIKKYPSTDKKEKKMMKAMTDEEAHEILEDIQDWCLYNPLTNSEDKEGECFNSAYANVLKNCVDSFLSEEEDKANNLENFYNTVSKTPVALKDSFKENQIIYGGFSPPIDSKEDFRNYWIYEETKHIDPKNPNANLKFPLSLEPTYSLINEMFAVVDYIWYKSDQLQPVRVLDLPNFFTDLAFK